MRSLSGKILSPKRTSATAVAEIVAGCTDSDVEPKPPWRARKEAYIGTIATKSRSTRLLSAADKLHNARAERNRLVDELDRTVTELEELAGADASRTS